MTRFRLASSGPSFALGLAVAIVVAACTSSAAGSAAPATAAAVGQAVAASPASSPETTRAVAPSLPATEAPSVNAAPAATAATAPGSRSAAAWCGFVVEVNTKYGYMVDKTYRAGAPTAGAARQILTEALARKDEWLAETPADVLKATQAELAYYQRLALWAATHGWSFADPSAPAPTAEESALIGTLVPYQQEKCGIKFGG